MRSKTVALECFGGILMAVTTAFRVGYSGGFGASSLEGLERDSTAPPLNAVTGHFAEGSLVIPVLISEKQVRESNVRFLPAFTSCFRDCHTWHGFENQLGG